jgi:hypothetical protein
MEWAVSAGAPAAILASTSLQRTYRYLRIATALTVVAIFVGVLAAVPAVGWLPSISHYYYSPARTVFTGALVAAAVCLFALSGRGPSRALLDAAALFAPLVAIIPASGLPGARAPQAAADEVAVGLTTYLVIGVLVVAVGAGLALTGEVERRAAALTLGVSGGILVIVAISWAVAPEAVLRFGHVVAAVSFFALIAVTALVEALGPASRTLPRWLRTAYIVLGAGLAVVLVATLLFSDERFYPARPVLIGESIALVLFATFWVLQTAQNWRDPNPALR